MLEEETTGMSASRPPTTLPKAGEVSKRENGSSVSNKRNQKKWRDGQGAEYSSFNRPAPPKQVERNQRPRGVAFDRQREEVKESIRSGQEALTRSGSKKANLNHLLNFYYESRNDTEYVEGWGRGGGAGRNKWKKWGGGGRGTYNKEQFLQANCQFIVKDTGNYIQEAADPDSLVDWSFIEQVRISGNHVPSCPICLETPMAARITKCGHVYCWSCMLHYLALSEKSWGKCPICYDAVQEKDLKSVIATATKAYKVGDEITMRLMKRERGSTYCVPVEQWEPREGRPQELGDAMADSFGKLLTATPEQVLSILKLEMSELEAQKTELGESLEGSYVTAAMELLKERQILLNLEQDKRQARKKCTQDVRMMKSSCEPSYAPLSKESVEYACALCDDTTHVHRAEAGLATCHSAPVLQSLPSNSDGNHSPPDWFDSDFEVAPGAEGGGRVNREEQEVVTMATADGREEECSMDEVVQALEVPVQAVGGNLAPKDEYYFYQSADGQHTYLHNLNTRCLLHEYGSLEQAPATITATIIELHSISMSQTLRERLRYLNHLPLTCEFQLAELALKPPLLSHQTLQKFAAELEKRQRDRQKKEREEKKQLKKMQSRQYAKFRSTGQHQPWLGNFEFPDAARSTIVQSAMPSLVEGQHGSSSGSDSHGTTPVGSPPSEESKGQASASSTQFSFAQMLRSGKPVASEWPSLKKSVATEKTSDDGGFAEVLAKTTRVRSGRRRTTTGSDESEDDGLAAPEYNESFGDAVQKALNSWTLREKVDDVATAPAKKGKVKKNRSKQVLFSTSMSRSK